MMLEATKFKYVGNQSQKSRTIVSVKNLQIGNGNLVIIAGPCAIESEDQIQTIAKKLAITGAHILRGGAFKPRTSPYDFQGLGKIGLKYLSEAARANHLLCVSELMDFQDIDLFLEYVDIIQIGARNMQNFSLLKQLGNIQKPILLKRGMAATYYEFLSAAEYIMQAGNSQIILCERGIRSFETYTRNTLDLSAVPVLHQLSHLPIIVDPSHATGIRNLVPAMAMAAVAAGADGVMLEVHSQPDQSLSDAQQAISPEVFEQLVPTLQAIAAIPKTFHHSVDSE